MKNITSREMDVLLLIVEGKSNQQIADELGLKVKWISKCTSNIYDKLDVISRTQAAIWAYKNLRLDI